MERFIFVGAIIHYMRYAAIALVPILLTIAYAEVENPSRVGNAQLNFTVTGQLYISGIVNDLEVKLYVVPDSCEDPVYSIGETHSDSKGSYIFQEYESVSSDISWFMLCDLEQQSQVEQYNLLTSFPEHGDYTGIQEYTDFTNLVDYNNDIATTASEIASGSETNLEAIMRLAAWVYNNVDYNLSYVGSIKKASWIMENRKGVCAEYSTLFMALVRSLGFPARYVSGWAYGNVYGAQFNTHAWTEVYLEGEWIPFDPTYGEFGYVDALHIPVSRTIDGNQSTINVRWYPPGTVSLPSSVENEINIATYSDLAEVVTFETSLYRGEVGTDDYTLLTVDLTNPTDKYIGVGMMVIRTNSTELVYNHERTYAVLEPHSTQTKYFILHMGSCEREYPYYCVNPLEVYVSGGGSEQTSVSVKPWIDEKSTYNEMLMLVQEETTRMETGLEIVEIGLDDVFYEQPQINITVKNVGNTIINNLVATVAYAGSETDVFIGNLLINEMDSGYAIIPLPSIYGDYDMDITFVSNDFSHTVERSVTYAQEPVVYISYVGDSSFTNFDLSNFLIVLDYERCENVSITLSTSLSTQHIPQSAEMYNITLPSEYFVPGTNTLAVTGHCMDPHGTSFDFEESFEIKREVGGLEMIFFQISSFFAWIFNAMKNFFVPS
jgi:transglutaminase-like putative cysteine protease